MRIFMKLWRATGITAFLFITAVTTPQRCAAQTISEPATIFYGKVLGTGSAQDFLITEGTLDWTIQRPDGSEIHLSTDLFPLNDGALSYRLDIPHDAFAFGLEDQGTSVPLPPTPQTLIHSSIQVDGQSVELLGPATGSFTAEQIMRTATYRLDLAIGREALDSDGDGIPDAWEDQYGLDKQNPADADVDLSGDGLSALNAYLRGLDPNHDTRSPSLLTTELAVYPGGLTGLLLDTADLNSAADQLEYTVTGLPVGGQLVRRNARPDALIPNADLAVGDTFTQDDLLHGLIVYNHDGSDNDPGFFSVDVRDEDPLHAASSGKVQLLVQSVPSVRPLDITAYDAQRFDNAAFSAAGYVILDGSALALDAPISAPSAGLDAFSLLGYYASYGRDLSHAILGGTAQSLAGGAASDVITAGEGSSTLSGGQGADRFLFRHFGAGRVEVTDFSSDENDVVDLSRLPAPVGASADQFLRVATTSGTVELQLDLDGDGTGFSDLVIALPGMGPSIADLYDLVASGSLDLGELVLEPRISVATSVATSSENGPTAGRFTLTRDGDLDESLTVDISLSGSAQNGVDYALIQPSVAFPSGVSSVDLEVMPHQDSLSEPGETVQLLVNAGSGYQVGLANQASVIIEDQLILIGLEVLEPVGVQETGSPAIFVLTRSDLLDQDVLVRLDISGSASNGVDYESVPGFILMNANQTRALIQITPKAGSDLSGGVETVDISIVPDAAYLLVNGAQAQVALVDRLDNFAGWQSREFPGDTTELATFMHTDSGQTGVTHFERYVYGLDAHQPDKADLPRSVLMNGEVVLSFRKVVSLEDVSYRLTGGSDLTQWSESNVSPEQISAPNGETDPHRVYFRLPSPANQGSTGFIVLEADWTP